MNYKINTNFGILSDPVFLAEAGLIVNNWTTAPMTTRLPNPIPAPYPSRTDLSAANAAFVAAYDLSKGGSKSAIADRIARRATLTDMLKSTANYVSESAKAAEDVTLITDCGFKLTHPTTHTGGTDPLPAPQNLKLRRGDLSGVLIAGTSAVNGAGSYETQICIGDPAVEANWKQAAITTGCRHIELSGLVPGTIYNVRVRAIGPHGAGAWSDIASLMAV